MKRETLCSKKGMMIIVLLAMLIFSFIAGCGEKEEEYRQIQVYKIDGTATVDRKGSSMDAYENMQLQSGDMIETAAKSSVQLKLDEDKYVLLEADSKISLQATGNSVDSHTSIHLEKGAIVNQLDNPLSEDSSYQVTTPNSTMAVRGTTFRVEITLDEKGDVYAKVAVLGGKVECNLVLPDGTITEPYLAEKGTEVLIWGDDTQTEYVRSGNISYEEMKGITIEFLNDIIERGEEISISKEEMEVLKEAVIALEEAAKEGESSEGLDENLEDEEGLSEEESDEEDDSEEETDLEDIPELNDESDKEEKIEIEKEIEKEEKEEQTSPTIPTLTPDSSDSADSGSGDSSAGGSTDGGSSSGSTSGGTSSGGSSQNKSVTIKFVVEVQGSGGQVTAKLFASKVISVGAGETELSVSKIKEPLLQPTANGSWDYVNKDMVAIENNVITIKWNAAN